MNNIQFNHPTEQLTAGSSVLIPAPQDKPSNETLVRVMSNEILSPYTSSTLLHKSDSKVGWHQEAVLQQREGG